MADDDIIRDLLVRQGSRYLGVLHPAVSWLDNLVGYSARGTVRRFQAVDTADDPLAELDDYLTVDGPNGLVTIDIPADASALWGWTRGHYQIEIYNDDPAHDVRVLQGEIRVDPEVTF